MNPQALAQEIIDGRRLTRQDDLKAFLTCDLQALCEGADKIRKHFVGERVDLCSIINGRSGRCPENCKFCAQSAHNHTDCEVYSFLPEEDIVKLARLNQEEGVHRFSIVTAGKALTGEEFDKAIHAYETMHRDLKIDLCASMGFLSREQLHRLHEAGVTSYHHNIETSKRNFPNICTTHTYDMKINTLKMVKEEGMCACSGGIIGMGETWEDRLDMAISLAELGIDSIPLNALIITYASNIIGCHCWRWFVCSWFNNAVYNKKLPCQPVYFRCIFSCCFWRINVHSFRNKLILSK